MLLDEIHQVSGKAENGVGRLSFGSRHRGDGVINLEYEVEDVDEIERFISHDRTVIQYFKQGFVTSLRISVILTGGIL